MYTPPPPPPAVSAVTRRHRRVFWYVFGSSEPRPRCATWWCQPGFPAIRDLLVSGRVPRPRRVMTRVQTWVEPYVRQGGRERGKRARIGPSYVHTVSDHTHKQGPRGAVQQQGPPMPTQNSTETRQGTPNTRPENEGGAGGTGLAVDEDGERLVQCLHRPPRTNRKQDSRIAPAPLPGRQGSRCSWTPR